MLNTMNIKKGDLRVKIEGTRFFSEAILRISTVK
jgi:hypothetical protein